MFFGSLGLQLAWKMSGFTKAIHLSFLFLQSKKLGEWRKWSGVPPFCFVGWKAKRLTVTERPLQKDHFYTKNSND